MAIKENFDLPQEVLHKEGNIWINRKNNQLRYSVGENVANEWLNPLSTYKVGTATKLKKGQPVSIGLLEQLDEDCRGVGDNAIVASDPSKNQFSVGILLEPGNKNSTKEVHVQSHGQIVYDLANKDNDNYYLPPHTASAFDWKYTEIGKPVYVSNKNPGELTLDLAEATYNGGTIICVGRLADAPLAAEKEQKIVIEIALSGDVRGVVDTTQISVKMQNNLDNSLAATDYKIASDNDKIFAVKIVDGVGHIILNNAQLSSNAGKDSGGVFVASPENGKIDLTQYFGKDIIITRLGIVEGNFGFGSSSFGKTAFLNKGEVSFSSTNDSVEYKVGVGFGNKKFLVDCRYAKSIQKSEMIGTIKPVYGEGLVDPGFVLVDPSIAHTIYDENIDWEPLIRQCYAKDIFVFSATKNGEYKVYNECGMPIEDTSLNSGDGILSKKNKKYFKFRELYYTVNDYDTNGHITGTKKCACQIKYSREGSPESQAYVWPEQCYQLDIPYKAEGTEGGALNSSNLKINITNLVQLGAYMDNNGQNIEAYDIIVQEKNSKQTISPGFSINSEGKYFGYEWQITTSAGYTFLNMVTQPDNVLNKNCLGITWPIGQKCPDTIQLLVTVRRRPTQYNSLYLNQFPASNPWTPLVDSANNLVIAGNKIYLGGKVEANITDEEGSSGFTRPVLSSIELCAPDGENTAGITYRIVDAENKTDRFVEKFVIGEGKNAKEIVWSFDLTDPTKPVAELNAQFAASFMAESTADEEGETYKGKALELFNVINPDVFERKSDGKQSVSIIKRTIENQLLTNAFEKNYIDNIDDFRNENIVNNYKVKDNDDIEVIVGLGWNKTHDRLDYQSYLGLLAKAASEAEEKLLKIERILYGVKPEDYYSDLGEYKGTFKYYVDDIGILRFFDFLENIGFIQNRDYSLKTHKGDFFNSIFAESMDKLVVGDYSSWLLYYIVDNFGNYNSIKSSEELSYQNELKNFNNMFENSEDIYSDMVNYIKSKGLVASHTVELWSHFKNQKYLKFIPLIQVCSSRAYPDGKFEGSDKIYIQTIDNFTFKKLSKGYNTDEKDNTFDTGSKGYNGSPYLWPLTLDPKWESKVGFTLEENFFGNNIVGISDAIGSSIKQDGFNYYVDSYIGKKDDELTGTEASFSPQSVEGIIYDLIVKLSYIRKQFNVDGTFDSKKTFISSFSKLTYNTSVPIISPISEKRLFNNVTEDERYYSVFTFSNDKVLDGGSLFLEKDKEKIDVTNFDISSNLSSNEFNTMNGRWGNEKYIFKTDNGIEFKYKTQLYALYLISQIAGAEASLRNMILEGVEQGYNDKHEQLPNRPLTDAELDSLYYTYNGLVNSLTNCQVYTNHAPESVQKIDTSLYPTPFGSYSEEIAKKLTISKNDFKNGKNVKLVMLNTASMAGETYESVISQNYKEDESEDNHIRFAKAIYYGFEPGNSLAEDIFKTVAKFEPESKYYEILYPSWNDYSEKGYKTWITYNDDEEIGADRGIWKRCTFDFRTIDKLVTTYSSPTNSFIDKYKIFFGFLPTATCQGSSDERIYPWTQQPIANNGLTWKDKSLKTHSTDFNDFINKTFYSFDDFLFNPIEDQNTKVVSEVKDKNNKVTSYEWKDGTSNDDKSKHDSAIKSDESLKALDTYFKDSNNKYSLSSTVKVQIGEKLQPTRINSPITQIEEAEIETKDDRAYEAGYFFDNDTFDETSYDGTSIEFDSDNWKKEKLIKAIDGSPVESWKTETYKDKNGKTQTRQVRDDVNKEIAQSEILASEWKKTTLPHRLSSVVDASSTTEKKFIQAVKDDKTDIKTGLKGTFNNNNSQATYVDTEYSLSGDTTFVKTITHKASSASLQKTVATGVKTTKKAVTSASKAAAGDYKYVSGPASGKSFAAAGTYSVDMSGVTVDLKTGKLSGSAQVTVSSMTPATQTLKISDADTDDFITELSTGEQSFTAGSLTKTDGTVKITASPQTKNASFGSKTITVDVADHDHGLTLTKEVVHVYGSPDHYYKNYYTKPLNRKQLKLKDAYEFKPIYKTIDRLSNDRVDYLGEMYHSETTTIKPQIYGKTSEIRKFAFKDDSYINGAMLPVPDIKNSIYSDSIMQLFKLSLKMGPSKYDAITSVQADKSSLTGNFLKSIKISDTDGRTLFLKYRDVESEVSDITLITFGVDNPEDEVLKESVHLEGKIKYLLAGAVSSSEKFVECFRKKQNYFVILTINPKAKEYILSPAGEQVYVYYKDKSLSYTVDQDPAKAVNFIEGEDTKVLDLDNWKDFIVQNCLNLGTLGNKIYVADGKIDASSCYDDNEVLDNLKTVQSLYEQRKIELIVRKKDASSMDENFHVENG